MRVPRPTLVLLTASALVLTGCGADPTAGSGDATTAAADASRTDDTPTTITPTTSTPTTAVDAAATDPAVAVPEVAGMVIHASEFDVDTTIATVQDRLSAAGMVVATVDHAAGAASVGQELRPTTLVIGGAPAAGTPLLQAEQTTGVDLPQKFLAWEAADGTVYLGYNDPGYVAALAGIDATAAGQALGNASATIAAAASGTAEPVSEGEVSVPESSYLVDQTSDASVAESIARYEAAFADADLMAVATVDHAAGATSIGEELRPTQVTFVGNPMVGTQLIAANQTMGIDLPIRYLAWEDAEGVVHVGHPDIRVLADRHGLTGVDDVLTKVKAATAALTGVAAGTQK